jgi:hypothetical protein
VWKRHPLPNDSPANLLFVHLALVRQPAPLEAYWLNCSAGRACGFEGLRVDLRHSPIDGKESASRLCDEAKPGQILISPRVLTKVENAVTVEPVGEFALKGRRRPDMLQCPVMTTADIAIEYFSSHKRTPSTLRAWGLLRGLGGWGVGGQGNRPASPNARILNNVKSCRIDHRKYLVLADRTVVE